MNIDIVLFQKVFSDEDRPSELLPQGWNQEQSAYTLRYTKNKEIFILHGIVSDETLLVNLLDAKTLKTSTVVLKTREIVKSVTGTTLDDFIPRPQTFIDQVTKEIIKPLENQDPPASETTQASRSTTTDPLLVRPPNPVVPGMFQDPFRDIFNPLRDVGRGDLDPFGRGGGMLFRPDLRHQVGPFNPLMPGGVPPGARFDPPNPFGRLDPDNDHMRPPPGYDDMFM